nr:MAG TPA: hypothetical protein [Caudoviricetes sp.]
MGLLLSLLQGLTSGILVRSLVCNLSNVHTYNEKTLCGTKRWSY